MIYLLDANVFMHVANKASGYLRLEQCIIDAGAASLRISAVTLAELRFKLLRGEGRVKKESLQALALIVGRVKVEPFTARAAECAALVMHALERGGKVNNWPDVMIAGQSIAARRVLVTDDAALLALPQVKAENWRASSL